MALGGTNNAIRSTSRGNSLRDLTAAILPVDAEASDIRSRARAVAEIAASHAVVVDRDAKFPDAAITAAKEQRLLGILIPVEFGGEGAALEDVVGVCYALGRACASTAMIYAMHQIMVACLVHHARSSAWHCDLLRRIAQEQLLLASSTTDGQGGGDLRKSDCAIEQNDARFTLVKSATVLSYGKQADALLTTARRNPDAPATDQVLVALSKGDYRLDHLVDWDTLGTRSTCSTGFTLTAAGAVEQLFSEPYHKIHSHTVMPVANLTWAAVWAGIAASTVDRARASIRKAMRKSGGQLPIGAAHLTRATASLAVLRATIAATLQEYEILLASDGELDGLEFQTRTGLLKVNASELATSIVMGAFQACGLAGYRNDGEFSVARQLRDIMSSSIMINNDRILANIATTAAVVDVAASITD